MEDLSAKNGDGVPLPAGNDYDDIELDEQEVAQALSEARRKKYNRLEQERKQRQRLELEQSIKTPFTPKQLAAFCMERFRSMEGREFIINEHNKDLVNALAYYFTGHERFEGFVVNGVAMKDWRLAKGLLLVGDTGRGKSALMRFFSRNKRQCFDMVSCRRVAQGYQEEGVEGLLPFIEFKRAFFHDASVFFQPHLGFCFDDLGTEDVKNKFGNKMNVMTNVLLDRYDKKNEFPFYMTHITTNLSQDEIKDTYGSRVLSRLKEMFNLIKVEGEDWRTKL